MFCLVYFVRSKLDEDSDLCSSIGVQGKRTDFISAFYVDANVCVTIFGKFIKTFL